MKSLKTVAAAAMLAILAVCASYPASAQDESETVIVSTLAGGRWEFFADGQGSSARFYHPSSIAIDAAGNFYVADTWNHRIRKITPKGEVSTIAGSDSGFADGQGSAARFNQPTGIAIDAAGNLFVADKYNHLIRKITPKGEVSTLAGDKEGFADGQGSAARFHDPSDIAIDAAGNLYVADYWNYRIRKVTPKGEVSTFAGNYGDGEKPAFMPSGIMIDAAGNLYVTSGSGILKVTPKGEVSIFASRDTTGFTDRRRFDAEFHHLSGITIDAAGNLYVADTGRGSIHKVTPEGVVSTLTGNDGFSFVSGWGTHARFPNPSGIAIDAAGNLYVTSGHYTSIPHRIHKITPKGEISAFAGGDPGFADGQGSAARFHDPRGIAVDAAGNLYVADEMNSRIRKVTPKGEVSTLAGGKAGFTDGEGSAAQFRRPFGIAIDVAGNLYVADTGNYSIRKVTPKGEVGTFAGGNPGFADGQGSVAQFADPRSITIDAAGNLYVAGNKWDDRIRKITPKGEVSTLTSSDKLSFVDERQGSDTRSDYIPPPPSGIAIDAAGNLYVADTGNNRIRKVTPKGEVSTLAGGEYGFADGQGSAARFDEPHGIAIDTAGNLYVADYRNHRIRKITPKGKVSTIAGGNKLGSADGQGSAAQFRNPSGIVIDAAGNLYVTDNNRIRKIEFRRP